MQLLLIFAWQLNYITVNAAMDTNSQKPQQLQALTVALQVWLYANSHEADFTCAVGLN